MLDVAAIAKQAMDDVAAELSGVIHNVTLAHIGDPTYDTETGTTTPGAITTSSGRAIDESGSLYTIAKNVFPTYVITGAERILFLEGLSFAPVQEDLITSSTIQGGVVKRIQDLLGTGQAFRVIIL